MKYRQYTLVIICLMIFLLLTSCTPWVVSNQASNDNWLTLNSGESIGQTFVAKYAGLQAVYFLLSPEVTGDGILTLHIRSSIDSSIDINSVKLPVSEITSTRNYRFDFPVLTNSANQYFYAILNLDGTGTILAGSGLPDSYQEGSSYQNASPMDAQLTFSLDYDRLGVILGLMREMGQFTLIFITCVIFLVVPGWALMSLLWNGWNRLSWLEKVPLSIGVSMPFFTLFVMVTYLLHLQLGRWYVWLPALAGGVILIWRNRQVFFRRKPILNSSKPDDDNSSRNMEFWPGLSLALVVLLIVFSRYWAMRGLEIPMWNDSLHHTEITQLILDNNGLFSSWMPYAPYQTFSMHYGFPMLSAFLAWISGLTSEEAVLYVGQILNILACLALYPIAVKLSHGNWWGGVVAVLCSGLLSSMPAFYINWGRYAQLAGQVIFPIAMWLLWESGVNTTPNVNSSPRYKLQWVKIMLTGGVIAGMLLYEFRMLYVVITFVAALLIVELGKHGRNNFRLWLGEVWRSLLIGFVTLVLFLPWGIRLLQSNIAGYSDFKSPVTSIITLIQQDYQTWNAIRIYVPAGLIILGIIGWVWSMIRRDWRVAMLGLWVAMMASLYSLIILHLPWVQYVQSFAVIIALYIPIALLLGYTASSIINMVKPGKAAAVLLFGAVAILSLWGSWNQRNIVNPEQYALVTQPDIRAMTWIREHILVRSFFLVEGTHENWVSNIVGTDAGWWIPLLARRENNIPPQYALSNEQPIDKNYSRRMIDLQANLEKTNLNSQAGVRLLCENGITHVYIGQKQGSVGNQDQPLFTIADLADTNVFHLQYHQDRVYIYSFEGKCGQ